MADLNELKPVGKLNPFAKFCCTIGNLPTSYMISLTYEEQLLWLCNYLEKTVIPAVNTNAEAVQELQNLYVVLKNYVDNYFDNLDVQDEINNKLDEMAKDGTLQEIISKYLNTKALLGFDNISDMINSENLIEGSYAQTFGFYNVNDGGSKKYKIIKEQNAENVNGRSKINLLHDDLYAISIDDFINVKEYGAKGDGITDDTEAIQFCIDNFPHKTIYLPDGRYLLSHELKIYADNEKQINLYLENNAELFSNTQINSLLNIGLGENLYDRYKVGNICNITGGIWNCENVIYGIYMNTTRKQNKLFNMNLINVGKYGIYIKRTSDANASSNHILKNIFIHCKGSEFNSTGLYIRGLDNSFNTIIIAKATIAIDLKGGGNLFNDIDLVASYTTPELLTSDEYDKTIGLNVDTAGVNFFNNLYIDTYANSIVIVNKNSELFINNFYTVFWKQESSFTTSLLYFKQAPKLLSIINADIQPPTIGKNIYGINTNELSKVDIRTILLKNKISFINCKTQHGALTNNYDLLHCLQLNEIRDYNVNDNPFNVKMTANSYYPIAFLSDGDYYIDLSFANEQAIRAHINISSTGVAQLKSVTNIINNANSGRYKIALANQSVDNKGNPIITLCVSATLNNSNLDVSIYNIEKRFLNKVFQNPKFSIPLENPTIIQESSFNP